MAKFNITQTTTVAELKSQFSQEIGGVLRIYEGRSEASEAATLVSLGATPKEWECRTSRTVGSFEKAFQDEINLKVKVYTRDNWVKVLDDITLETASKLPNGMTKAKMEAYVSNYATPNRKSKEEKCEVNIPADELTAVKKDGKWGFVDTKGNVVIESKFDYAYDFEDGCALVKLDGKFGYIDTKGNFVIEPKFDDAYNFSDGLAQVELDGKWGFIDTKGNFVIEPKFDYAVPFKYNLNSTKVNYNGKWGAIDRSGDWVVEPTHTKYTDFEYPE